MDHAFHTEAPGRAATTIGRCVSDALQAYLEGLHGHEPGNIFHMVLREVERPLFEVALSRAGGNIGRAAQILGMNRATLRKKLKKYDLMPYVRKQR